MLVTPETAPLGIFGAAAAAAVARELDSAGIALERSTAVTRVEGGALLAEPGRRRIDAERIVTLPRLRGRQIDGLPADDHGFIPIDEHARVAGRDGVYAAGDGVAFPIKQGGIATQQADAAAEAIAAQAGARVDPQPFRPVLRGMLLTGDEPRFLQHELNDRDSAGDVRPQALWWPPHKIAGRYLAPYLAEHDAEGIRVRAPQPEGMEVEVPLEDQDFNVRVYPPPLYAAIRVAA